MTLRQRFQLISCLVFAFSWMSKGYTGYDEEKRNNVIPILRLGRGLFTSADDWKFSPRTGRSTIFYFVPEDFGFKGYENSGHSKRSSLGFVPRIGRKKRTLLNEELDDQGELSDIWSFEDDDSQRDFQQIVPAPRLGRSNVQLRSAFVPRIGRDSSVDDTSNDLKRAAFTPRIGRAPLIPRIGRSDTEMSRSSRVAFTPRIGRAPFVPRIGRSSNSADKEADD
ncbi:uncharacterized protein LOC143247274 [Tachypleus tridentatus]|uniref:uncharacterized protein LOC143247274 n=1 Tax=Tachypleus tridentatus TaxID=6853 RepID=UPI003FD19DE1